MESPQTEQAETSLRDELKAALTQETNNENTESQPEVLDTPDEEGDDATETEREGDDTSEDGQTPDSEEVTQEEEESSEEKADKEFPLVPNNWSKDEKAAFQSLLDSDNPELKEAAEIFIDRHNSMKKTFFKKTEELAKERKEFKPIKDLFQPFEQHMANNGVTKDQYIKNMITYEIALKQRPVETIKEIMGKFGVTPEQLGVKRDEYDDLTLDDTNDNVVNNLVEENKKLRQEFLNLQTQVANQPVQAQLRQFEEATDATGKLLHPHFAEVKPIMGQLLQDKKASTLEDAYAKAIKVLDLEETEHDDGAEDLDKIRRKLARAKKATKSVSTKGAKKDFGVMTIKEELKARGAANATRL